MFDIIVIGSASRDVFLNSSDFTIIDGKEFVTGEGLCLPAGAKIEVKKVVFATGGGGTNNAVTYARQGLKTACIGVIGSDINGAAIIEELARESVDTSYFQKHDDDMTAYSVILVQDGGERTILSYKGEGQHFQASIVPFSELKSQWLFLDSLGGHYDLLASAVDWAVKNKVKIATNPGSKELQHGLEKLKPLLQAADIVSMNQEEAGTLLGKDYQDVEGIFQAMDALVKGVFVMTRGHDGVIVSDGTNRWSAGVPDSPVVERTGAGDAFVSGFVAEYIRSADISKSIQLATANASSVVTHYGAKAGILKKGEMGSWPLVEVTKK